ncbi:indolepyruvate ferredoxin oxidoreductase family protein [Limnobacter sp.]|uniref:indolepyruvate ferredoxin oxidoreductase family protein n=1 Tax=Limnobacter sp. TaxID=2003368 RepID=UPI0035139884
MNAPRHPPLHSALQQAIASVSLDDKYTLPSGRVFLNGAQALVRLTLLQAERDRLAGLNTAGFVSGYRGSPLGGVDLAFAAAKKHLQPAGVRFQPGLNEDLAATAVWGSQQVNLFPGARFDGVFGMWYGKGPGVDRSLDVFKHANAAGTSPHGGVLLVAGDDHAAKSSTLPHQSDHVMKAALMPVVFPSNLQEVLDYGVLGYAMSRYAGVWVGFKTIADVIECSAVVEVDARRVQIQMPQDFDMPPGGLNIRWPDTPLDQEARLLDFKLYAALAFARANRMNHTTVHAPQARMGIVASGKAYQDTMQALHDLGLTSEACARIGLRVYKVGMVWPLDAVGIREFAQGLREILVVEEKRQMLEYQIKEELYAWRADVRPKVYGKYDERVSEDGREGGEWSLPQGQWLLPSHHELDPALVTKAIAKRLMNFELPPDVRAGIEKRLAQIAHRESVGHPPHDPVERKPYFCSGCPHNTSTRVPEGSRAMAGIGCHYMAVWMDRNTQTYTQMGGEGVPWIGQAPFTETPHVFANLGDGTYFHSGILAIRASVAAGVNITYKLLYNDAVAMTGGQHLDGTLTVPQLTRQLDAEGVARIVIVSDNPEQHRSVRADDPMAPGVQVFHRDELDDVQRTLRSTPGTTVLVYEQTCASEKRRRRKRTNPATGQPLYPNPAKRVFINPRVCEGCGDCSKQSNCLSIEPLPTPWGIKRTINQSTCNKDYSCLAGLCPSLVTVEGAELRKPTPRSDWGALQNQVAQLPPPAYRLEPEHLNRRYAVLINGVGGTGVITIGAWLGMAAHLQGLEAVVLDMAGLAQKGGAVFSHVQIAPAGQALTSGKIAVGEGDLMLGGDLLVSSHPKTLELLADDAYAVVNTDSPPTADFIHQPTWHVPVGQVNHDIEQALNNPAKQLHRVQAQHLAQLAFGDTVYANALLLGYAWQTGALPLHLQALRRAIELNGVQIETNLRAFDVGRLLAHAPEQAMRLIQGEQAGAALARTDHESNPALLQRLSAELAQYQNQTYAQAFEQKMRTLAAAAGSKGDEWPAWWQPMLKAYYRLLAFKDEYEVARLLSDTVWQKELLGQFDGQAKPYFYFAPTWLKQPEGNGRPRKWRVGPWALPGLRLLARLKGIRGTVLDPFKNSEERKMQQTLVALFESWLLMLHNDPSLLQHNKALMCTLDLFNQVKGFGQVRLESCQKALPLIRANLAQWKTLQANDQSRIKELQTQGDQAL